MCSPCFLSRNCKVTIENWHGQPAPFAKWFRVMKAEIYSLNCRECPTVILPSISVFLHDRHVLHTSTTEFIQCSKSGIHCCPHEAGLHSWDNSAGELYLLSLQKYYSRRKLGNTCSTTELLYILYTKNLIISSRLSVVWLYQPLHAPSFHNMPWRVGGGERFLL